MAELRLLQLIANTDDDLVGRDALHLHGQLQSAGIEVRTLALTPGSRGGLDSTVPAIAPSSGSFAARSGVAAEQRWADVVLFHGGGCLGPATAPTRAGPVTLLHLSPERTSVGRVRMALARRSAARFANVSVARPDQVAAAANLLRLDPSRVGVLASTQDWLELLGRYARSGGER